MNNSRRWAALGFLAAFALAGCGAPGIEPTVPADVTEPTVPTATVSPEPTATPEPSLTPTEAILDLEILEWYEHAITNLVDPSSGVTQVEVLIRNPNDFHVSIGENAELRFLNSAGEVVYTNPSPSFYIWQGEWMTPGQTAAIQACMCLESGGLERPEWESLELIAPLEITNPAYTTDVEVTAEFVLLEEVLHGYSGPGVAITLTNTSDQVLESISKLVFARDASGRYVGMASSGSAVVSVREVSEIEHGGIQPGDTASGYLVSEINYLGNERLTYEVAAIGIIHEALELPSDAPLAEWEGIPIMPGAIGGEDLDYGYQYTTSATVDEVVQFYESELPGLGFEVSGGVDQFSGAAQLTFSNGETNGLIGVAPLGDITGVAITFTN